MTEVECITKKWGSSIGIVIPNDVIKEERIKPNEKVTVNIKKGLKLRDVFGILPRGKIDTQTLKDRAREGWEQ